MEGYWLERDANFIRKGVLGASTREAVRLISTLKHENGKDEWFSNNDKTSFFALLHIRYC